MFNAYLSSQNGALDVPFGFSFPDNFDLRSFFMRIDSLHLRSVIVRNNLDEENDRQVETFDALNWACSENLGGCFVE
jgi:hypothetical protein